MPDGLKDEGSQFLGSQEVREQFIFLEWTQGSGIGEPIFSLAGRKGRRHQKIRSGWMGGWGLGSREPSCYFVADRLKRIGDKKSQFLGWHEVREG